MNNNISREDMLEKLRAYATTPDDDNIRYKEKIKHALLNCPELLFALNEKNLESELFYESDNGQVVLNISEDGELLGEVDRYFGDDSNIRPYLFIPETQADVRHYVCYEVDFDEIPRYNKNQKYIEVSFNIFVNGRDVIDKNIGVPRHDLIASIIREKFNWSNIFGAQTKLVSSKESVTDKNYLVRTLIFQNVDTNSIVETNNGITSVINNHKIRR